MAIKQRLKNQPVLYQSILSVLNTFNYFNWRFNRFFPRYRLSDTWRRRIELVKASPDNSRIKIVADAGKLFPNYQLMHNGLKITLGSYYDYGNTILLEQNKGIHEPQEEFVFQEILKVMNEGACMVELGSYWAFYSMWFAKAVKKAKCFMVEPDPHKMNFGKLNFKLNNLKGTFELGFVGGKTDLKPNIPTVTVDHLVEKHKISFIDILHSDIQGYEYQMLKGAEQSIREKKIGYIFISTHSNELHNDCTQFLTNHGFTIVSSANLDETYSWDGLIVAKSKFIERPSEIPISIKQN